MFMDGSLTNNFTNRILMTFSWVFTEIWAWRGIYNYTVVFNISILTISQFLAWIIVLKIEILYKYLILIRWVVVWLLKLVSILIRNSWGTLNAEAWVIHAWLLVLGWMLMRELATADQGRADCIEPCSGETKMVTVLPMIYLAQCLLTLFGVYRCAHIRFHDGTPGRWPNIKLRSSFSF